MSNNIQIIIIIIASLFTFRYLWQNSDDIFYGDQGLILGKAMIALLAFLLFILAAKIQDNQEKDISSAKAKELRKELREYENLKKLKKN